MKKLLMLIPMIALFLGTVTAQEVKKKEEMKVVVVKKKKDENGKVVEERIEATGKEASELLEKMKKEEGLEDLEMDIEVDEKFIVSDADGKEKKVMVIVSDGKEVSKKMRNVNVQKDGDKIIMKINEDGEEKEFNWVTENGELPDEVEEMLEKEGVNVFFNDGGAGMIKVEVEDEIDEDLPEVNVFMGVVFSGNRNIRISQVEADSPAQKAGLLSGDLITEIDNYYLEDYSALITKLSEHQAGDKIKVRYIRDGKAGTTEVKLAAKE